MTALAAALAFAALAALAWSILPRHGDQSRTRMVAADPGLLAARREQLHDEQARLEASLDLLRGVFEVSAELVGCVEEADLRTRLAAALGRYWRGAALDLLVWERGAWRSLGAPAAGPPPELGAPVHLPDAADDLVLDLSPGVDGQAALALRQAREQPSIRGLPEGQRRAVAELLRGQFALSLRRVALYRSLQELARIDPLTGAWRRWYGEARLAELAGAGAAVAVCMVDIDHFKRFNDRYGHAAGDRVLAAVGRTLRAGVRGEDLAARHGGEEFLVILPGTPLAGAVLVAERLRAAVAAMADLPEPATVSLGVAASRPGEGAEQLLARADQALYRAKEGGRDRVIAEDGGGATAAIRPRS